MKKILTILLLLVLCACKSTAPLVTPSVHTDSVSVSSSRDSIRVYERDSVFVDRFFKGDTIWLTKEKFSIRYRDREVVIHDTISTSRTDTIYIDTPKPVPRLYKDCTWGFFILLLLIVGRIALRIAKAVRL